MDFLLKGAHPFIILLGEIKTPKPQAMSLYNGLEIKTTPFKLKHKKTLNISIEDLYNCYFPYF